MVKKVIKKVVKKGIKKIREQSGAPEGLTARRAAKAKEKKAFEKKLKDTFRGPETLAAEARLNKFASKLSKAKPTGITKAKPTGVTKAKPTGITKAKPTKGKVNPRAGLKKIPTTKVSPGMKAAIAAPAVGLAALAVTSRKKPATKAAKVTFGEAFKEARKKGEGTKFTFEGKSYTAVTKDDLKKKGYDANELKQYANRKGKARGPVRRAAQGIKKVLLGKDKKFGGDKGAIDFIRRSKPKKKMDGGMANSSKPKKYQSGGMAPVAGPRRPSKSTLNADLASGRALSGRVGPPRVGPPARPTAPKKVNPRGNPSFGPPGLNKGGMATKKYKAGGLATKGLGKAFMKSKR